MRDSGSETVGGRQWVNFKNLDGVWKLKKFYTTCIELIFKFLS